MKFLCVCRGGNVRSVSMAHDLHERFGQEAIPLGYKRVSKATLATFCEWADVVVIMEERFREKIPEAYRQKIRVVDVGQDRYGFKRHPELGEQTMAACAAWRAEGFI